MAVEGRGYASLRVSTRALPASKRLPALRELFDRSIQLEIDAEPGQAVEMEVLLAPGLRRAKMLSSLTARVSRPAPKLADGEDTICLMMKTGGHLAVTQGRREGVPRVGDGVLLVYREPAPLSARGHHVHCRSRPLHRDFDVSQECRSGRGASSSPGY